MSSSSTQTYPVLSPIFSFIFNHRALVCLRLMMVKMMNTTDTMLIMNRLRVKRPLSLVSLKQNKNKACAVSIISIKIWNCNTDDTFIPEGDE